MTMTESLSRRTAGAPLARPAELACFALIVAQAVYLVASYLQGSWLLDPVHLPIPVDFVNVWAAGQLALSGHAAAAYDWPTHKIAEELALGHEFQGYFGWHYPPTFLFVATALAALPYTAAFLVWTFGTFPAYLAAIRAIVGDNTGYWLAAAFPALLANFMVGQNGFFSAALFGGALVLLPQRPAMAGVLFGLLTYKPHLGFLIPIALIAGGQWRAFIAAGLTTTFMAVAAWAAFGPEAWHAFIGNIGHTSQAFLSDGWANWGKLQTAFGLVRTLGGSEPLAWSVQGAIALAAAVAVAALWRGRADDDIKAAALGAASLIATPYLYTYDLVVLAVPLAFFIRAGRVQGFLPHDVAGIAIACALIFIFPGVRFPVGFMAVLIVAALIARRVLSLPRVVTANTCSASL